MFPLNFLGISVENQLSIYVWFYFCTLWFILLAYISILIPIAYCLVHCQVVFQLSFSFSFFLNIFIDYAIIVVPFLPLHSTPSCPSPPFPFPLFSLCPWLIHISSLASTFPILFLPSPCLFSTYHLCYLFSVRFPPLSPSHSPVDNPPCDLHLCGSVPVLVVGLVCFCFCFRCGC